MIIIRALLFYPSFSAHVQPDGEVKSDFAAATDHLAQMVRLRTVSSRNPELVDQSQFEAFRNLLPVLYPEVAKVCPREFIGETGMLYCWKGKEKHKPNGTDGPL